MFGNEPETPVSYQDVLTAQEMDLDSTDWNALSVNKQKGGSELYACTTHRVRDHFIEFTVTSEGYSYGMYDRD